MGQSNAEERRLADHKATLDADKSFEFILYVRNRTDATATRVYG
jgi:hypothetical protein